MLDYGCSGPYGAEGSGDVAQMLHHGSYPAHRIFVETAVPLL